MLRHTMVTVSKVQHGCKVKERRSKKVNKKYQKVLALHRVTLYNISVVRKGYKPLKIWLNYRVTLYKE